MANTGVQGRVVDKDGAGIGGLTVVAYDVEVLTRDDEMGSATTSSTGDYTISYSKWEYGWERKPDIRIEVFDFVHRLIYRSSEYQDISATTFPVPTIKIPPADLEGWLVTLRTGSPKKGTVSQNNLVKPIIDNKIAWEKLTTDINNACNFVHFLQFYWDIDKLFTIFTPTMPPIGTATSGHRLENALLHANQVGRATVRVLICDVHYGIELYYPLDTADHVEDYFNRAASHTVRTRKFRRPLNAVMHAKFTVIDGKVAHINGSILTQEYFDDTTHSIDDPRRGRMIFPKNQIKVPIHDVGVSIKGPAIEYLDETFVLHWRKAGGTVAGVTPHVPPATSNAAVQIVRTLPGNLFTAGANAVPDGETGILEAYQRAFRNATDFIYLENQYFTNQAIADSLMLALALKPNLQVIMLINSRVDAPLYGPAWYTGPYQGLQNNNINRFLRHVKAINASDRVGIFTLWTHKATAPQRIIRNYVHSKVGIVDDKWATIGSANLDGVSLILSQHVVPPITNRDVVEERAIEVNAVIFNHVGGQPASSVPDELRRSLWKEHLGFNNANHTSLTNRPAGGWLSLWKKRAAAKLAGLKATPPTGHQSRILEWKPEKDPKKHLLALRVPESSLNSLTVETEVRSFDFSTGQWK